MKQNLYSMSIIYTFQSQNLGIKEGIVKRLKLLKSLRRLMNLKSY